MVFAIALNLVLAFVNFTVQEFLPKPHRARAISFAAGVAIAYLMLLFMPELMRGVVVAGEFVFLAFLIGFSSYYLAEQFLCERCEKKFLHHYLHDLHVAAFAAYHVIVGIVIWKLVRENLARSIVFTVSIGFLLVVTSGILTNIHMRRKHETRIKEALLSLAFPIGALAAGYFSISDKLFYMLFGFLGGALMYVLVREVIPPQKKGSALYFLIGVVFYTIALTILGIYLPLFS